MLLMRSSVDRSAFSAFSAFSALAGWLLGFRVLLLLLFFRGNVFAAAGTHAAFVVRGWRGFFFLAVAFYSLFIEYLIYEFLLLSFLAFLIPIPSAISFSSDSNLTFRSSIVCASCC